MVGGLGWSNCTDTIDYKPGGGTGNAIDSLYSHYDENQVIHVIQKTNLHKRSQKDEDH